MVDLSFKDFAREWDFKHQVSSLHYPKYIIQRNVKTAKNLLRRCQLDKTDVQLALLMLRNTPTNENLKSAVERLYRWKTRTIIPITKEEVKPKIVQGVSEELRKLRIGQGVYADRISNPMKPLQVGEKVRMQKGRRSIVLFQMIMVKSWSNDSLLIATTLSVQL